MASSDLEAYSCDEGGSNPEAIQDLMTIDDFRHIALAMPGTEELNGMGYPKDSMRNNRI
jgi:hypothetical protein